MPPGNLLITGFLGAWADWNNDNRSLRKLARSLRDRHLPGAYVGTAGNHDRRTILRLIHQALDHRLNPDERRSVAIACCGQSFDGAACVKLARELNKFGIPLRLTVQIDSVGHDDDQIPPNVARALNLYQHDPGPLRGQAEIKAADPSKTTILGNECFSCSSRDIDMHNYLRIARRLGIEHWTMDNDTIVWKRVESAILAEIAARSIPQF